MPSRPRPEGGREGRKGGREGGREGGRVSVGACCVRSRRVVGVGSKRVTDLTPARMTFLPTSMPSRPRPEGGREGGSVWKKVVDLVALHHRVRDKEGQEPQGRKGGQTGSDAAFEGRGQAMGREL